LPDFFSFTPPGSTPIRFAPLRFIPAPLLFIPVGLALLALLASPIAAADAPAGRVLNGFRLDGASVPVDEILRGGPGRDGIPALDHPKHVAAREAAWPDNAMVLGFEHGGEARAYPVAILDWHELVNDTVGGQDILVSYCPLCGTGIIFDRRVAGRSRKFGVSGLLYHSDVLMYDHETGSLWSQIASKAITGPSQGVSLKLLRSQMERWGTWRARYPQTQVLTPNTGFQRDYGASPYRGYDKSPRVFFPVPLDKRYHPKTPTIGLQAAGGAVRAYPADEVRRAGGQVEEEFAGRPVVVAWDDQGGTFHVTAPKGVEVVQGYWFAWAAFHPDTSVFVAP